jgi:hypothetical protein
VGFVRAEGGLVGGAAFPVVCACLGCWWCLVARFVFRVVPVVQTGGLVLLTRKSLATNVLNSSLDLSFYASV